MSDDVIYLNGLVVGKLVKFYEIPRLMVFAVFIFPPSNTYYSINTFFIIAVFSSALFHPQDSIQVLIEKDGWEEVTCHTQ